MNCPEFESIVCDLARDLARAEVSEAQVDLTVNANGHQPAVDHAGACGACALRLQDERALSRALASVVTEMKTLAPAAGVEQKLLDAFRQAAMPMSAPRRSRVVRGRVYGLAAAAAALLIIAGVVSLRALLSPLDSQGTTIEALNLPQNSQNSQDSTPAPENAATVKESAGSVSNGVSASNTNFQAPPRPARKRSPQIARRSLKPARDASLAAFAAVPASVGNQDNEVTTQFIALSYLGPASLQDGGQIVRVELPRSAMASFGLPVNMDRFGEKVRADVFVSADGFARAIRFVQ